MPNAKSFQNNLFIALSIAFHDNNSVIKEWSVWRNEYIYAPRLDIAVGVNASSGNQKEKILKVFNQKAPDELKAFINRNGLKENQNPRCALAIEIVFSGSSKHILGDITNSSMMGLYGFVIAHPKILEKVNRVFEYTKKIKEVGKAPHNLFPNVTILSTETAETLFDFKSNS
jgi:hypothetical protein